MPSFNAISRRFTPEIVLSRKNLNSASKVANWIIVDIQVFLLLKDHISLCVLSFNLTVAYRSN